MSNATDPRVTSTDGHDPSASGPAPGPIDPATGMHTSYWILTEEERAKGFVRPVRVAYLHAVCGSVTRMSREIAETYARQPTFYGATFCCACRGHFPVGEAGEFTWADAPTEKVGT